LATSPPYAQVGEAARELPWPRRQSPEPGLLCLTQGILAAHRWSGHTSRCRRLTAPEIP